MGVVWRFQCPAPTLKPSAAKHKARDHYTEVTKQLATSYSALARTRHHIRAISRILGGLRGRSFTEGDDPRANALSRCR